MLKNVHLRNLALIKEADIDFTKGLNIMTGETGAGKSIIIGSINIALGDKANKSFIRKGSESGSVELQFISKDQRIKELLASLDIPSDEDNIIVTRKLTQEGSTSKINGQTVTLATLRAVTSLLVDIHGQHDNQSLLNPVKHLDIIDEFAGHLTPSEISVSDSPAKSVPELKKDFHDSYLHYKELRKEISKFTANPEELAKEASFIDFEYKEIEEAALTAGEDAKLEAEYKRLSNAEKISSGINKINSSLFSEASGISSRISDALRELTYLTTIDPDLKRFSDALMDIDSISRDLGHEVSHYISSNSFDGEKYKKIHERLNEINRLKSKYGSTIEEILTYQENLEKRLKEIKNFAQRRGELLAEMDKIKSNVNKQASALSNARKAAAKVLEEQITGNLKDLNFLNVDFQICFTKADKIYENGFDKVEFMLSTNIGEPVKPLVKVASGGELSRVMLAIKASVADADKTDTLIFDEIDTGISGRTAQKVAEKLALLSQDHQLICITHLPQIAAMADAHFEIAKAVSDGSTISGISRLSDEASAGELARLISGSEITETSLASAIEMKAAADKLKSASAR